MKTFNYKGTEYFEFQREGFASRFAFPFAKELCIGRGLDIGCGKAEWVLPGAIPIENRTDFDAFHLPDGRYDYIFSSHCLEHLNRWTEALAYWDTKLVIGGVMFLYLPHYRQRYWRPWNDVKHIHALCADVVSDCLHDMGYKVWTSGPDLNDSFYVVGEKMTKDNRVESFICRDGQLKLIDLAQSVNHLDGVCSEVGVLRGGSALLISEQITGELYLFDTFSGLPNTASIDGHIKGEFANTSEREVRELFHGHQNVIITAGIFPQTAKIIENKKFKFVHLDVDIYQSYKDSLEFFYPRMVVGGIIVMDDYHASECAGAKIAIDEFLNDKPEKIIEGGGGVQVYIVKK